MAIALSQLAQMTARAGLGRAGTCRAGCAPDIDRLKPGGQGLIIWDRPTATDGDPAATASSWTTERS